MPARSRAPWHTKFNLPALLEHARQLRSEACSCDLSKRPISGSLNWTFFLSFEDDVEWVFRSPNVGEGSHSLEIAGELLESEVATMKYIKLNSSIPIPDIFDHSSTESNVIGISFIMMSKAPGRQLQEFGWDPYPLDDHIAATKQRLCLNKVQKEKIMRQLGKIASQLSDLRFDEIGSLIHEAGDYQIGKSFSPAFIFHDRDTLEENTLRGPFIHGNDYYGALISVFLLHVQELRLQHNVFFAPVPEPRDFNTSLSRRSARFRWEDFVHVGTKIDSWKNRLDYCTAGHFLRLMVPFISGESSTELASLQGGFPLCHPDLSTGNIFVDDDLNITCVIDWAFASTVPMSTALMTPGLPSPRDDTDSDLNSAFRSGFTEHYFQNKKKDFPSKLWEYARRTWLFTRLTTLDGSQDYYYFRELYMSVYKPEEINLSSLFKTAQKEGHLAELASNLADDEDEDWTSEIAKQEQEYFSTIGQIDRPAGGEREIKLIGIERQAIARKITMVSAMSHDFVADGRLWRWIEGATRDLPPVDDVDDALGYISEEKEKL